MVMTVYGNCSISETDRELQRETDITDVHHKSSHLCDFLKLANHQTFIETILELQLYRETRHVNQSDNQSER